MKLVFCSQIYSLVKEICKLGGDLGKVTKKQATCVKRVVLALGELSG